ncbi:hypothetical protein HYG87_10155 [Methanobacterium alkalithermotolerans]|uniref:Uncharacterized protein n=1 Tax=Methanobacterium alkalithermotolerans TaxID=2731220 RepID=A0A8T8KBC0_9EURY|nr:hypothetical protein [Methanobacterium alkalithermotolerans]QUH24090.1 hypothetical protein HYG87_10155 [Methanobacterium alkalithermotolerans]RJS48975.1 MAG: hypothetical protein CIT03_05435 [Methanobacterium sp.]
MVNYLLRGLFSFFLKNKVLSIGTKYYPTNSTEREYVEMINYTQTMLLEIEKANITTNRIFENLINELGPENIPDNRRFIELKPAEDKVDEYALLSNIVMGSDRYLYVELFNQGKIIQEFADIIKKENGTIIEQSSSEIVAKLLSKNDAIRVAIELIRLGADKDISVRASAGMTGAAAIERSINLNKEIGEVSGVGFTKLGGEFAIVFPSKFSKLKGEPVYYDNYLFIDVIDSTQFIAENGRDSLVEIMNDIKAFIEKECKGKIEGYREGGDDLIANLPTKDAALRAAIDSSWHGLNNGAKIRSGIGRSRREAGERAQLADSIKLWNPSSVIVFDLADGIYGYFIPSEFTRSVIEFLSYKKSTMFLIFFLVFIATFIGWNVGYWQFGLVAIILAVIYAITT